MKKKLYISGSAFGIFVVLFLLAPVLSTGDSDSLKNFNSEGLLAVEANGQYVNLNNYLIVYMEENYRGRQFRLPYETTNTHMWNFYNEEMKKYEDIHRGTPRSHIIHLKIKSIKLHSFTHVTLFEGENYSGYCMKITKDLPSVKGLLLTQIKSLSVGRACPDRLAVRRFNAIIDNTLARKIRYRFKVNGKWEAKYTDIRRKTKAIRGVDSRETVYVEMQFLDLTWRKLCDRELVWNRNNYITVRKEGRYFKCDLKH